jgi:hypothetical protein
LLHISHPSEEIRVALSRPSCFKPICNL